MRDTLDDLLEQFTLLTIAAAIALGYAVLNLAQGVAAFVLSALTERRDEFDGFGGTLTLDVGGRTLEFAQLASGIVTLAVVLAAILYVLRLGAMDELADQAPSGD